MSEEDSRTLENYLGVVWPEEPRDTNELLDRWAGRTRGPASEPAASVEQTQPPAVRTPASLDAALQSLAQPGTTVVDPQALGYVTPEGTIKLPADVPDDLKDLEGARLSIGGGKVGITVHVPIVGDTTLTANVSVTPEGRIAISGDLPGALAEQLNGRIPENIRITDVKLEDGKITVVTAPRAAS